MIIRINGKVINSKSDQAVSTLDKKEVFDWKEMLNNIIAGILFGTAVGLMLYAAWLWTVMLYF